MKKITLIILVMVTIISAKINAQSNMFSAEYTVGLATGDMNDFISKTSWRGATLEFRKMVDDGIGVGIEVGWSAFYESPGYITITDGTQSLTGTQYRYLSTVPLLATLNYYLKPGERINPYAGLGVGTEYSQNDVDMGLYRWNVETWHFAVKPEVGVIFETSPGTGIIIAAKYYQAWKTNELDQDRSYFTANIGFVWEY